VDWDCAAYMAEEVAASHSSTLIFIEDLGYFLEDVRSAGDTLCFGGGNIMLLAL